MKPALAFREPQAPTSWQHLPAGEEIQQQISAILAPWSRKFFGYYLLKIGALSGEISLAESPIKQQITVSPHKDNGDILADIDELPFLEHSVDVCVLANQLEFSIDPHHVIREANRVLIPNGYFVITGFNPFSFAALNKLLPYKRKQSPWNEHFFSAMRVKDWLQLLGYEILADERCVFSSLMWTNHIQTPKTKLQQWCQKLFPSLGAVYVIVAKKRVLPLTPIKPKWRFRPQFSPVNVSTRVGKIPFSIQDK
jgi:SAM-dependent methyltransferase